MCLRAYISQINSLHLRNLRLYYNASHNTQIILIFFLKILIYLIEVDFLILHQQVKL